MAKMIVTLFTLVLGPGQGIALACFFVKKWHLHGIPLFLGFMSGIVLGALLGNLEGEIADNLLDRMDRKSKRN